MEEGLNQRGTKEKQRQQEADNKRRELTHQNSFLLYDIEYKYIVMPKGTYWTEIPDKYLDYQSGGAYDIRVGEFALNDPKVGIPLDADDIRTSAMEDAEEEYRANMDIPEKPSESYGQDDAEVDADIGYEWEEFVNDFFGEVPENKTEEECIARIKEKFKPDFIKWKIEQLQEEEEGKDAWKYSDEVDYNDSDYLEKVTRNEESMAEEIAWEGGLVTLKKEAPDFIEIWLNKKFFQSFLPILQKMIKLNRKAKDDEFDEPLMHIHHKIEVYFPDTNKKIVKSVYDWMQYRPKESE